MHDGRHLDQVPAKTVYDPIVSEDELAKLFPAVLRDDAAGLREILHLLDVGHDALDE